MPVNYLISSTINSGSFFEIMLHSINMDDQDFIWRNVCTLCVQECQLVASAKHELCDFIGKCRLCDNYINPYQSPNKYVEYDLPAGNPDDRLVISLK
jgi:hypothetical protein